MQHLLEESVKIKDEMPVEARELMVFLPLIIDATTKNPHQSLTTTEVECFEKGCNGLIKTAIRPDTEELHWFCPDCENEGLISGWQKTKWDNSNGLQFRE